MQNFSIKCAVSGKYPKSNAEGMGDTVHLFLLNDGEVVERLYGNYDGAGSVYGQSWKLSSKRVAGLVTNINEGDGVACVIDQFFPGDSYKPTVSEAPEFNQGLGKIKYMKSSDVRSRHEKFKPARYQKSFRKLVDVAAEYAKDL